MATTAPSTTLTAYTIDNAPREADLLAKIGKYQLRRLAESPQLGFLTDEAIRAAYLSKPVDEQAKELAEALRLYDGGGKAKPAAPVAETPTLVSEVVKDPPKREPRVTMPDPEVAPAPARKALSVVTDTSAASSELLLEMRALKAQMDTSTAKLTEQNTYLNAQLDATRAQLTALADTVGLLTSLTLMVAEPALGGNGDDLLRAALEEAQGLPLRLRKAASSD
jgi:hypothetical protein